MKEAKANTATPAPLERILVRTDEHNYRKHQAPFATATPYVQQAVTAFAALNVGEVSVEKLLALAASDGLENYVRDYIYEHTPAVKALPLTKTALLGMVELPKGFKAAKQAFDAIRDEQSRVSSMQLLNPFQPHLYTVADGKVTMNAEAVEKELDLFRAYLDKPEEIELYHELKALTEKLNDLHQKSGRRVLTRQTGYGVLSLDEKLNIVFLPERLKGIVSGNRLSAY